MGTRAPVRTDLVWRDVGVRQDDHHVLAAGRDGDPRVLDPARAQLQACDAGDVCSHLAALRQHPFALLDRLERPLLFGQGGVVHFAAVLRGSHEAVQRRVDRDDFAPFGAHRQQRRRARGAAVADHHAHAVRAGRGQPPAPRRALQVPHLTSARSAHGQHTVSAPPGCRTSPAQRTTITKCRAPIRSLRARAGHGACVRACRWPRASIYGLHQPGGGRGTAAVCPAFPARHGSSEAKEGDATARGAGGRGVGGPTHGGV